MEHIAPLIQTVLWVGLIGGIVWRFHKPIHGLLTALQGRIEAGSTVRAGPFEIAEPVQQQEKVRLELAEMAGQPASPLPTEPDVNDIPSKSNRQRKYLQAEDLALRAIQAEVGQPISRQVRLQGDKTGVYFDGVFESNGVLNVVEVKYVPSTGKSPNLRMTLIGISNSLSRYAPNRQYKIILALVFENQPDPSSVADALAVKTDLECAVVVRPFSLAELQKRFGFAD